MKRLYITRHAKSSWEDAALQDFDRPLNERGKRNLPFMGDILQQKITELDVIISSPALRAYTTAIGLAEKLAYPHDAIVSSMELYEADKEDLLKITRAFPNDWRSVMLVGHNPTLTEFVNYFCDEHLTNLPTCGIVGIAYSCSDWEQIARNNAHVEFFEYPKKYTSSTLSDF